MSATPEQTPDDPPGLVRRPAGQLHDLPVEIRWEVSRRHPYYLMLWEEARRYRRGVQPGDPPGRAAAGYAATLALGALGVVGEPVDPAAPFADLVGPDGDPAFLSGSVQPMTLRSVAAMLIAVLPPSDRAAVGALLLSSGTEECYAGTGPDALPDYRAAALGELDRTPSAALDSVPVAPLFYVHLGASQRAIARDMEEQVRRWKAKRGGGSSKVQAAKLPEYLEVWDLREGWAGGGYDPSRELTFKTIAGRLKQPLSTVAGRYRAAFEFVVGHEFTPELWWRVFGPLKYGRLLAGAAARPAGTRRHTRSPLPRPVPDSVVSAGGSEGADGVVGRGSVAHDDIGQSDLRMDLQDLIARGLSDEEIADRLDLADPSLVGAFRRTCDELQQASR